MAFRQFDAQELLHEVGVTDLRGETEQCRGLLRIENRTEWHASEGQQRFDVLARGVQQLRAAAVDERRSRVVELRFFGGLTVEETAGVLDVSPETVMRDWKVARAWLFKQLNPAPPAT